MEVDEVMQQRIGNRNTDYIPFEDKALLSVKEMCVYFSIGQTIYAKTLNEIRQRLRNEQYEDEKNLNVVSSDMTLDEWFDVWMDTCKKNCRNTTRANYTHSYNRIRESLGWRKLNNINLITMQQLLGLKWSDIDFENQTIYVNRTLVYVTCKDEISPKYGKKINEFHEPKTEKGKRKIPTTLKAYQILKRQKLWKVEIEAKGKKAPEGFEDLVFVTTRNAPVSQNDTDLVMKFKSLTPHTFFIDMLKCAEF